MGSDTTDEAGDPSPSSQLNRAKYSALILSFTSTVRIAARTHVAIRFCHGFEQELGKQVQGLFQGSSARMRL